MKSTQSRKRQIQKNSIRQQPPAMRPQTARMPYGADQVTVFSEPAFLKHKKALKKPALGGEAGAFTTSVAEAILRTMKICGLLPAVPIVLSISYVSPKKMTQINGQFRGKSKPTDILSFEQSKWTGDLPFHFLGDLVVCSQVLRAQARVFGHTQFKECVVLLVHGCLHLLGFDHEKSKRQADTMTRLERKIIQEVMFDLSQQMAKKGEKSLGLDVVGAGLIDRSRLFSAHYGKKRNRTSF